MAGKPTLEGPAPKVIALPQCWGHRGASSLYPENTLASFEAAIKDGVEGIESDVHVSSDNVVLMHHDSSLDRTTSGKGLIKTQPYHGVLDSVKTRKSPHQGIATFQQTMELLMRQGSEKVTFNIDVKVDNDPSRLFSLMHSIVSSYPDFRTNLGPRLVLGLWHPKFIDAARQHMPYAKLIHIGSSPSFARKYFWDACSGFSINFASLITRDGQSFRKECKKAGKELYVWTVNERNEMIEATKWGVTAILTDKTAEFVRLRNQMTSDWEKVSKETSWMLSWTSIEYLQLYNSVKSAWEIYLMTRLGGPLALPSPVLAASDPAPAAPPVSMARSVAV